jgi:hypothetical protein
LADKKLSICFDAIDELISEFESAEDVRRVEATLNAIASALIQSGLVPGRPIKVAMPLPDILKRLARKGSIESRAVTEADRLLELSKRGHYLEDIDDDAVDDAETARQALLNDLREFLNRAKAR